VEVVVEFALVQSCGCSVAVGSNLTGHFEVGLGVDALVDLSKCSFVQFADDLVVLANFLGNLRHAGSIK
jgi:hypothetical protein